MNHLMLEVTDGNFQNLVLESEQPVLIEFTADWCPPCRMLAPIIHEIAHQFEGRLRVGLLDSDANPEIVQRYEVMGLPTLILFMDGSPVERILGYTPRNRIEAKILPHLAFDGAKS